MTNPVSRRAFLQRTGALSIAGAAAPWALNLAAIGEAAAATATDYKALVCVFLYGGNDYANTVVPYDTASYAAYRGMRPTLAYSQASLASTVLAPTMPSTLPFTVMAVFFAGFAAGPVSPSFVASPFIA